MKSVRWVQIFRLAKEENRTHSGAMRRICRRRQGEKDALRWRAEFISASLSPVFVYSSSFGASVAICEDV